MLGVGFRKPRAILTWSTHEAGLNGKLGKKIIKCGSIYKEQLDDQPAKHWDLILTMAAGYVGKKGVARAINIVKDDTAEMDDPEEAAAYNNALFDPVFNE